LYGYETWTLTLNEERALRMSENRTGCWGEYLDQRGEVSGGWRRPHEDLHNLYASPNFIRV